MRLRVRIRRAAWLGLLAAGCHSVTTPEPEAVTRAFAPRAHTTAWRPAGSRIAPAQATEITAAKGATPTAAAGPQIVPVQATTPAAAPAAESGDAIDLGVALRLAGVENPAINLAREQVREALAGQLAARALLLPNLNAGANVRLHRGTYQASGGFLRTADIQSLYVGAGARAVGGGPPVTPGVWLFVHLGDAVYERLAAAQRVTARGGDAAAVQNAVLRDVAATYLDLAGAEARLAVLKRGGEEVGEVVRLTSEHARAGTGRKADADRATATAELVHRDTHRAEEDVAVASARLCRLLSLDPALGLHTAGGEVHPVQLVPGDDLEPLVASALAARPEMTARSAAVQEAMTRVRQERARPWLPTVSVGFSSGAFGGGGGQAPSDFSDLTGRTDFNATAVWTAQNLGFGNHARVRGADAAVGSAVAAYDVVVNQVRREVAEALADTQAAARQIDAAGAALSAAEEGFRLETDRTRQGQGLPIETLDSFRQLLDTRLEVIRAIVAYDVAQFRLYAAVGAWAAPGAP